MRPRALFISLILSRSIIYSTIKKMELNQRGTFNNNVLVGVCQRLDELFPPECDREKVHYILCYYTVMDSIRLKVKELGPSIVDFDCKPTCDCPRCGGLNIVERKLLPPMI